jgi:hypothetical protein
LDIFYKIGESAANVAVLSQTEKENGSSNTYASSPVTFKHLESLLKANPSTSVLRLLSSALVAWAG